MSTDFDEVDEIFAAALAKRGAPTIAYGVMHGNELVHAAGVADDGHAVPTADHVFRIASMTKSFTAAAVLLLRDEGQLGLDDPVELHVPALENLVLPTADSPALTIRHLLTMSGGLPTDDPWADRQEAMQRKEFSELLSNRLSFIAAPGTTFEYSNLGYAILGRVITEVAGMSYHDVIRSRLIEPLGMTQSTLDIADVPSSVRMQGYRRVDDVWVTEPFTGPGEFSALGGLCSSVTDIAKWVRWLSSAALHRADGTSVLSAAARREMQQQHRAIPPSATLNVTDGSVNVVAAGYGFGLVVEQHLRFGDIASHSGGYPGFGTHMRWHMATGTGVIALSNGTYSGMSRPASAALDAVLRRHSAPSRIVTPAPASWAAKREVQRLLVEWNDDAADDLFADNVDLDEPRSRRKAAIAKAVKRVGPAVAGPAEPGETSEPTTEVVEADTAAHLSWWSTHQHGRIHVSMMLTPHNEPLVQTLTVRAVPTPSESLVETVAQICAALGAEQPQWPTAVPVEPAVDTAAVVSAAIVARRFGVAVTPMWPATAGNGTTSATVDVGAGAWQLSLGMHDTTLQVTSCSLVPKPMTSEDHVRVLRPG